MDVSPYRGRAREPLVPPREPDELPDVLELKPSAATEKRPFIFIAVPEEEPRSSGWVVAIALVALLAVIWIPILLSMRQP
jgi:hypothetical protein